MHNKALQTEAPRLSGGTGVPLGYPSPTATHLRRPIPSLFIHLSSPGYLAGLVLVQGALPHG